MIRSSCLEYFYIFQYLPLTPSGFDSFIYSGIKTGLFNQPSTHDVGFVAAYLS